MNISVQFLPTAIHFTWRFIWWLFRYKITKKKSISIENHKA